MANPFTLAHTGIWTLLDAHPFIVSSIKKNNKIKLEGSSDYRDPIKDNIQDADLPELMVVKSGGEGNFNANSSMREIIQRFDMFLTTSDKATVIMDDLLWAMYQALDKWKTVLGPMQLNGHKFIYSCDYVSATEGITDSSAASRTKDIEGWSNIWAISMQFRFNSDQMDIANFTATGA